MKPGRMSVAFLYFPTAVNFLIVGVLSGWESERLASPWVALSVGFLVTSMSVIGLLAKLHGNLTDLESWLAVALNGGLLIAVFALLNRTAGVMPSGPGAVATSDALTLVYFSVVTFTTLGYGDFVPHESMRLLAAFEAIAGYFYLGIVIAMATLTSRNEVPRQPDVVDLAGIRRTLDEALSDFHADRAPPGPGPVGS